MHPLRKLRESGKPTPAQVSELLAENIVFNSPILVRPIEGREVIAATIGRSVLEKAFENSVKAVEARNSEAKEARASWAGWPYRRIHSVCPAS